MLTNLNQYEIVKEETVKCGEINYKILNSEFSNNMVVPTMFQFGRMVEIDGLDHQLNAEQAFTRFMMISEYMFTQKVFGLEMICNLLCINRNVLENILVGCGLGGVDFLDKGELKLVLLIAKPFSQEAELLREILIEWMTSCTTFDLSHEDRWYSLPSVLRLI